jgi:hypothetical protein
MVVILCFDDLYHYEYEKFEYLLPYIKFYLSVSQLYQLIN